MSVCLGVKWTNPCGATKLRNNDKKKGKKKAEKKNGHVSDNVGVHENMAIRNWEMKVRIKNLRGLKGKRSRLGVNKG